MLMHGRNTGSMYRVEQECYCSVITTSTEQNELSTDT